jgi:RimJ/RimL family protein N-acetyltransferase
LREGNGDAMRKLIYDQTERVVAFMKAHMPYAPAWASDIEAIGMEDEHGRLIAGVCYENFTASDVNMHIVGLGANWMTREAVVKAFHYPFNVRGLRRVTSLVAKKNTRSIRLNMHLGFTMEGVKRNALKDDDLIIFGMTREDCRFIRKEKP